MGQITEFPIETVDSSLTGADVEASLTFADDLRKLKTPAQIDTTITEVNKISNPNISRPNSIALCGDSITDDSHSGNQWTDWGWGSWFRRTLNKNYSLDSGDIFAKASMGTAHLLETQLPQVISSGVGVCITMIGTNDLGSGVDIISNLETFYTQLESNGIISVALPILPRDDMTTSTAAEASRVNKFLYEKAKSSTRIFFISQLGVMTDYTTGNAKTGFLRDGLHTTKRGAKAFGDEVALQFNDLFVGADDFDYAIRGNQYDVTENPDGNAVPNPYMNGTSGILQNGATGDVADDLAVRRSAPTATFGLVASKEAVSDLSYQVITLSGTGDGNVATAEFFINTPSEWVEGDTLEGGMSVIAENLSGVGYFAVSVWAGSNNSYDGAVSQANGDFPASVGADYKAKVQVPASASSVRVRLDAQTLSGETLSGVIKISKAYLERAHA